MDLSVVIPCYNEEASMPELVRRVRLACDAAPVDSFEVILIDDGSSDRTWAMIEQMASEADSHIVGIALSRNHGHQLALTAGLETARGEYIFVIDADLQDPPELLTPMLETMRAGADVVYGQRMSRSGESIFKKLSAKVFYRLLDAMTDVKIPLDTGDFRLMHRSVLDVLNTMPESQRFIRGMVSWVGFNQVAFPYQRDERFAGETKYPLSKMVKLAFDAITSFSIKPLVVASYCGAVFGAIGLMTMFYVLFSWSTNHTIRGWTSVISVVLILGSVQLIFLGLIGEYLGRSYIESKRRPIFIIRKIVGEKP
jgi:dolichol-phosphate mannosyltransferase